LRLGVLVAVRSLEDAGTRLDQARAAGFSLCQLNLQGPCHRRTDLIALADMMLERDMRPVALGCYANPLRPDEPTPLGASRDHLDSLLHHLDIVGARKVVFFSGSYASTLYDPHPDNFTDEALEELVRFVSDVVARTRARHYQLVLEPWSGHVLCNEDRIITFHEQLAPAVAEHVRYVVDAPALITAERYADRDRVARKICRAIGPAAGVVHLRDCIMPPDGEAALPGPGQGKLDYRAYVEALRDNVPSDAPAVVRNVPPEEMAQAREYLLTLADGWQLT